MPTPLDLIRNIRFPNQFKGTKVNKSAFRTGPRDDGSGLSVYGCKDRISSVSDLDAYQNTVCIHPEGLLGICFLKIPQLAPLGLFLRDDPLDEGEYGSLHQLVQNPHDPTLCPNADQQSQLALAATINGQIRPMVPVHPI